MAAVVEQKGQSEPEDNHYTGESTTSTEPIDGPGTSPSHEVASGTTEIASQADQPSPTEDNDRTPLEVQPTAKTDTVADDGEAEDLQTPSDKTLEDEEAAWLVYPEWQLKLNKMLADACQKNNSSKVNELLSDADRLIYDCAQSRKPHHFPRLERALMVLGSGNDANVSYAKKLLHRINSDLTQETRRANQYVTVAFLGLLASPLVLAIFFSVVAWTLDKVNFSTDLVRYTLYDANNNPVLDSPVIVERDMPPPIPPEKYADVAQAVVEQLPSTILGFNKDLLLACGVLGVIGSIVSMIVRLGELEGAEGRSYREIFITSIFRPFVGFCFAILMLIAVQAGFLPFDVDKLTNLRGLDELMSLGTDGNDVRKQASLMFVLCFLAGFSERLGRDLINKATAKFEGATAEAGDAISAKKDSPASTNGVSGAKAPPPVPLQTETTETSAVTSKSDR